MKHLAFAPVAAVVLLAASAGAQTIAPMSAPLTGADPEKHPANTTETLVSGELWQLADAAEQAMLRADYDKASDLFKRVLNATDFSQLDSQRTHFALSNSAKIASMRADFARAHALYKRSSQHDLAGSDDWMGRLNASWFLGNLDDAAASLAVIARNWPEELAFVSEWAMDSLLMHVRENDTAAERMLLSALFDANWQTDLGREPTTLWLRLIELLAEDNAITPALTVSSRLRDPLAVVTLLSDRRFEPIVAAAPEWFNVKETMDAGIIEARLTVDANPHLLAPSVALGEALLRAGRQHEALLVIETQMARSALKSIVGDTLEDGLTQSVRALTIKALALISLERYSEAASQLELAAQQVLPIDRLADFVAVAQLQACLGLPDAALTTLERVPADVEVARTYFVRFMAARAYDDAGAQTLALEALVTRAAEAPAETQHALLLAGRIDAAARVLISRLNDPQQRASVLLELQRMNDQVWPEVDLDWRMQTGSLMAREDVRSVVAANGVIVADYAIYRWN